MRTFLALILIVATLLAAPPPDAAGTWSGKLKVAGGELTLVVHLRRDGAGRLTGTLDSPDQGARDIPIHQAIYANAELKLYLKQPPASFLGKVHADGKVHGHWSQGGAKFPLVLERGEGKKPVRPQEPKPPYPYVSEDVAYHNEEEGILLGGTFTKPKGDGPFAAALLITGSGAQDRDETILGHKPFLVLADHLTRRGIAVLRVDDRGVGKSTGLFAGATTHDFASDARAGLAYLRTRADVDNARIGMIGHSEGSNVAAIVAAGNDQVAFLVLLGGPGLPGRDIILKQRDLIAAVAGETPEMAKLNRRIQSRLYDVIAATPRDKLMPALRAALAEETKDLAPEQRTAMGYTPALLQKISTPWFIEFLRLDPRDYLKNVRCFVLAITGEKDLQVPPTQSLPEIEKALKAGGNPGVQTVTLPGLNHLFQTCQTGAPVEYRILTETFAPAALDHIGDYIERNWAKRKPVKDGSK